LRSAQKQSFWHNKIENFECQKSKSFSEHNKIENFDGFVAPNLYKRSSKIKNFWGPPETQVSCF